MTDNRPHLAETNFAVDTILAHHSVRSYSAKEVPPETLHSVLSAAQSAPSSSNQICWSVVVVRDPQRKARLEQYTGRNSFISEAPVFLVWVADLSRINRLCVNAGSSAAVFDYQEAILLGTIDTILAAQNAAVAAESFGLGTCYVGGIRSGLERVAEELELPQHSFPVVGMAIGWPGEADTAGVKPRPPLSGLVFEETYDAGASDAAIPVFDQRMNDYNQSQERRSQVWSENSVKKWATTDWIRGREANRDALIRRGFKDK